MQFSRLALSVVYLSKFATGRNLCHVNTVAFLNPKPTASSYRCSILCFTSSSSTSKTTTSTSSTTTQQRETLSDNDQSSLSPWAPENVILPDKGTKRVNKSRFRQHVNPLSRKFQMQTELDEQWPNNAYDDPTLPIHIDIGCGKGGFLLDLATQRMGDESSDNCSSEKFNYLGLEIRPSVALYAKERIEKWGLSGRVDFIGCNVNVDLERILEQYTSSGGDVGMISIQYPDPHFKKQHQKRRVVTPELVNVMAKFLPEGREIFIQSDIQDVLDNMRLTLRDFGSEYFTDVLKDTNEYLEVNPVGVATEREISVLKQDLPVYRTLFQRNNIKLV